MGVFRVEKNKNYTTMGNYHLKEKEMSLKAIGLLSKMLSLPDDWDYSLAGLISICKENETAIRSALDELKEFGYLEMIKKLPNETESGRIEYEYIIYEKPKQEEKKQDTENLSIESQSLEDQLQLSIKQSSIKNKVNNNSNIYTREELKLKENVKCIIDYLNESIGSNYRYTTKGTISLIKARFNDGYTLDDFYDVIDNKVKEWINDAEMCKYLRPETLFGNKFESYLNGKVFNGKPKTSYSSKSNFDNTADENHNTKIYHISDEEFDKLTHQEKIDTLLNDFGAVADMTKKQREFYNQHCVVHDWED